ncbi:MAG: FeoB-associated Cys-rich membrane protein [Clostridiales bacterium]|nr:FeoB-associated Cys-rich membrane protein [Clostridiales bacterium]
MPTIIIGLVIAGYTGYLIYRQISNVKKGNFCGNCSACPSSKRCGELKNIETIKHQ